MARPAFDEKGCHAAPGTAQPPGPAGPGTGGSAPARELLVFRLGAQEFCIDITAVREIRGWSPTTPLPHAPPSVRGVVSLRGTVLPVLDLAHRLSLPSAEPTKNHVVIVTEVGARVVGLLVSAVCDILVVTDAVLHPTPDVAAGLANACLHGLLTVQDRIVGLLRLDQLVPAEELVPEVG